MPRIIYTKLQGASFRDRYPKTMGLNGQHGGYVVPVALLAPILQELIEREGKYLTPIDSKARNFGGTYGAIEIVCERAARGLNIKHESIIRRVYDVLKERADFISADIVECLFIACDERVEDHPIPVLPANPESAYEMAEAWADDDDVDELANRLLKLTLGFYKAEEIVDPLNHAIRMKARRRRRSRNRQPGKYLPKGPPPKKRKARA